MICKVPKRSSATKKTCICYKKDVLSAPSATKKTCICYKKDVLSVPSATKKTCCYKKDVRNRLSATKKTCCYRKDVDMESLDKTVAQHNALINARFSFVPLQMRLFLGLLSRISQNDTDFKEHFVPLNELVFDRRGGSAYEQVDDMCKKLASFTLYIEDLEEGTRRRRRKPSFTYIPLMSEARYTAEHGGVLASFNPKIMPYLLQLRESGNFTTADLKEVLKLKSPYALRIYWLLKEYADFGRRTMTVEQLRFVLDVQEGEYPRFSNFKARILDKAQSELAKTDMPFKFELEREGKVVERIKFLFQLALSATKETLPPAETEWGAALAQIGLNAPSIARIGKQLAEGDYDLGYVDFVLHRIQKQHQLGKVKRMAGAIYKALVEKYLLDEYKDLIKARESKRNPKPSAEPLIEVAYRVDEVRDMYANPGPYGKHLKRASTFEEHLQQVYLSQGFKCEERNGEEWLVKY